MRFSFFRHLCGFLHGSLGRFSLPLLGSSLVLLTFAGFSSVRGATLTVRPDGTGDYPTIQAALDAASEGDLIALTDGVFTGEGNRDLDFGGKAVMVGSVSGNPEACLLDCQGSEAEPHRGFHFHTAEAQAEVAGITIMNGHIPLEPWGGAILCEGTAAPLIRGCVIRGNRGGGVVCGEGTAVTLIDCELRENSGSECGAVYCWRSNASLSGCVFEANQVEISGAAVYSYGGRVDASECVFRGNHADYHAGAIAMLAFVESSVRDCVFEGNSAADYGAVFVFISHVVIERCTFTGNTATGPGSAAGTAKSSTTLFANCTFWANGSPLGTLSLSDGGTVLQNCIVAGDTQGPSMYVEGSVNLSCTDVWGNLGGDWVEQIAEQYGVAGNICEDPQFCNPAEGDLTISETSPCAPFTPPNPECDLIGAWPVGCAGTPVESGSWGRLKASYRR